MRKTLLPLALSGFYLHAAAQAGGIRPEPHWMVGDHRQVEVTSTLRAQVKDSVFLDIATHESARLQVTDIRKERYILSMWTPTSSGPVLDLGSNGHPDTTALKYRPVMSDLSAALGGMETKVAVSHTGETEPLDQEKSRSRLHDVLMNTSLELMPLLNGDQKRSPAELDTIVNHTMDSLYTGHVQRQVDLANVLAKGFTLNFPAQGSERFPIKAKDMDPRLRATFGDMKGTTEFGLDAASPKELICRLVTTYEPASVLAAIKRAGGGEGMKPENISVVDESVYTIDRSSGWLTSSTTDLRIKLGDVREKLHSRTALTVLQP